MIFRGANYIVVHTEKNTQEAKELCRQIGRILRFARISELSPYDHDEMIGFVSQLTHCIAMCLMTCLLYTSKAIFFSKILTLMGAGAIITYS